MPLTHTTQDCHKQSSYEDPLRIQSFKAHKEMVYHFQEPRKPNKAGSDVQEPEITELSDRDYEMLGQWSMECGLQTSNISMTL